MPDQESIYLSFTSEDADIALRLRSALEAAGFKVCCSDRTAADAAVACLFLVTRDARCIPRYNASELAVAIPPQATMIIASDEIMAGGNGDFTNVEDSSGTNAVGAHTEVRARTIVLDGSLRVVGVRGGKS